MPAESGLSYITVAGFHIMHSAENWQPPGLRVQMGAIGPRMGKSWIIENCTVTNARCVGIVLGQADGRGLHRHRRLRRPRRPQQRGPPLRPGGHRRSEGGDALPHRGQPHRRHQLSQGVRRVGNGRHQVPRIGRHGDPRQPDPRRLSPGIRGLRHLDGLGQSGDPHHGQHHLRHAGGQHLPGDGPRADPGR